MLKNRRDRRTSLSLEDLEGRKLLSTILADAIQGGHIGTNVAAQRPLDLNPQPLPPGYAHVSME